MTSLQRHGSQSNSPDLPCPLDDCLTFHKSLHLLIQHLQHVHVSKHPETASDPLFLRFLTSTHRHLCVCQAILSHPHIHCPGPPPPLAPIPVPPAMVTPVPGLHPLPTADPNPLPIEPEPEPELPLPLPPLLPGTILPSPLEIMQLEVSTLRSIPKPFQNDIAQMLARLFHACSTSPLTDTTPWILLLLFPKTILRWSQPPRGGTRRATRRQATIHRHIESRIQLWNNGDYQALWSEAVNASQHRPVPTPSSHAPPTAHLNLQRAVRLARDGQFSRAITALTSLGFSPPTDHTLRSLEEKHPHADPPVLPLPDYLDPPAPFVFSRGEVKLQITSFPRGTSPGATGLRPQHLVDALHCTNQVYTAQCLRSLTTLCNTLNAGQAPPALSSYLAGAPLVALTKPKGGIRPIAIGETLRRLVSKLCCLRIAATAHNSLSPHQIGVATKGGIEAAIHSVRHLALSHGNDPSKVLLKVDFSNAFNVMDRRVILEEVLFHCPQLYQWVQYCYSSPSILLYGNHQLHSSCGVQQGDPLGPLLFSLGLHRLIRRLARDIPSLDTQVWFLDDGTIIGDIADVQRAFHLISSYGPELGLHINLSKSELWWPSRISELDGFPASIVRIPNDGVTLLGSPIGSPHYTSTFFRHHISELASVDEALLSLSDPHLQYSLLKGCLGFGKVNHLLRTCPPSHLQDILHTFDSRSCRMLSHILRVDLSLETHRSAWGQASLPIRLGGLGITHTDAILDSAYIGSCALSHSLICDILGIVDPDTLFLTEVQSALVRYNDSTSSDFLLDSLRNKRKIQHTLTLAMWKSRATMMSNNSSDRDAARLRGLALPQACAFLHSPPSLEFSIPEDHFRIMVHRVLGIPLLSHPIPCPACHQNTIDVFGEHVFLCKHNGGSVKRRHDAIQSVLASLIRQAGYHVSTDTSHLLKPPHDHLRPADLLVTSHSLSHGVSVKAIDVSIREVQQPSKLHYAASRSGYVAKQATKEKIQKYSAICTANDVVFIPMVWESTGGSSPEVLDLLRSWTSDFARRTFSSPSSLNLVTFQRISSTIHAENATTLLSRLPPPLLSLLLPLPLPLTPLHPFPGLVTDALP